MKLRTLPWLALVLALLAGCSAQAVPLEDTFLAMDTVMETRVYGGDQELTDLLRSEVLRLEGLWSATDETSEIYAVNHAGGAAVPVSADTADLLSRALPLSADTGGALSLTIYPLVSAWGFTGGAFRVPSQEELDALLPLVDDSQVKLDGASLSLPAGAELDLGAVAKGYTGEHLARLLKQAGVTSALLNLGGNIQTVGRRPDGDPWRVAIRDPEGGAEDYAAILSVEDEAVVTSGVYERCVELDGVAYWHILDPATGQPARTGLLSVSVVGPSGTVCDALSTALFVMGPERAAEYWQSRPELDFDYILLHADGSVTCTQGLEGRLTLSGAWESAPMEVVRR